MLPVTQTRTQRYDARQRCICCECDRHHYVLSKLVGTWAARYNTWLLIKLMPKGVVLFLLSYAGRLSVNF